MTGLLLLIGWFGSSAALAEELRVIRRGDTIESLVPDPTLAAAVRALNGLAPGAQPALGTVLRLPESGQAESNPDGAALVLTLSGTATATVPGGASSPVVEGTSLPLGTTVCTDVDSYLALRLAVNAGSRVHDEINMLAGTCVTLDSSNGRRDTRSSVLSVSRGSVSVRASEGPGTVAVRTESGVAAGEGGGFRVTVEDGATRTEALYAPVAILGAGAQVDLSAGEGGRVRTGEAPTGPFTLPPYGVPILPAAGAVLRRPDFTWTPVERALGYRVEMAASEDFADLVVVEEVDLAEWSPELLFVPYRVPALYWRVSSIDRTGFQGIPSPARAVVFPAGVGP